MITENNSNKHFEAHTCTSDEVMHLMWCIAPGTYILPWSHTTHAGTWENGGHMNININKFYKFQFYFTESKTFVLPRWLSALLLLLEVCACVRACKWSYSWYQIHGLLVIIVILFIPFDLLINMVSPLWWVILLLHAFFSMIYYMRFLKNCQS